MNAPHPPCVIALTLLLGACATVPQRSVSPLAPQCAMTVFAPNDRIGAWPVDKFAGRYTSGANSLVVRRNEHRLYVEGWILGTRELTADNVESWVWRDGCGVRYEFALPPDGPGAWLKTVMPDGSATEWHR